MISNYGEPALVALAGKGINPDGATEILKKESAVNKHLVELIIESEKEVLKHRFYRRKTKVKSSGLEV